MKQANTMPTLVVCILAVGLVLYFVFSFWESMTDTFTTSVIYEYTISESVESKGLIIREEVLLPDASGLLDVLRTEGEQVGVGQAVGRVYKDIGVMALQTQLEALNSEAESLEYAMVNQQDLITVTGMDESIVSAIASLRSSVAQGNFNKLETQVSDVKGTVLRRDYIFGSPSVINDIEGRYAQVVYEIANNTQMASGSVNVITTPVSGAYSILVDGLEYLDLDMALSMTSGDLNAILQVPTTQSEYSVGKIITGDSWYFVTAIPSQWASDLRVGRGVTIRFSGDFSQDITMIVEQVKDEDGDISTIVLSSTRYLEQTTLLRFQTVELVYQNFTGLRIPKDALRMVETVNKETEEVTRSYGVYTISAGYAEFKPVRIITEGNDFYLVESTYTGANALKQGNRIVVNAIGIYDGKLMEY